MDKNDQKGVYDITSLKQNWRNTSIGRISTGRDSCKWDQDVGISKAKAVQGQGKCVVTQAKFSKGGCFHPQNLLQNAQV